MQIGQARYTKEEAAKRGQDLYSRIVRPQVEEGNYGKVVAIDVESGRFELADDVLAAADLLRSQCPDAQIWFVRVGYPALHRMGFAHV
ncbi:MAG: hypothetical protein HYV26_19040 [Candidatus Hydrogenedentes bacterium]|nr:hypothetical protein [Candidatus Hydrogenedentota bacterium]MBI3119717.1 hypothetical protein [Candidatus Hydrogenedentota bacterium]